MRPDRLATCQSERKSVVSRRPSVFRNVEFVSVCKEAIVAFAGGFRKNHESRNNDSYTTKIE
jgi:hypothetical protein